MLARRHADGDEKPGNTNELATCALPYGNVGRVTGAMHSYFFFGTFAPFFRASERPIATACFRLVTFLPLRPLFSVPRFILCISFFTCLPAAELYFLLEDFLAPFLELDFFALFFVAIYISPALECSSNTNEISFRSGYRLKLANRLDEIPWLKM